MKFFLGLIADCSSGGNAGQSGGSFGRRQGRRNAVGIGAESRRQIQRCDPRAGCSDPASAAETSQFGRRSHRSAGNAIL